MIETVFIERKIIKHPNTLRILKRLPRSNVIEIDRYQELFNKRHQNFRLQKKRPSLILAQKHENFVLSAPVNFGMDAQKNYYFSHMYNCIYDCRYCFLQGMYSSANYLLFVNYEDFFNTISKIISDNKTSSLAFFSGYDCDSLAFEKISEFAKHSLNFFEKNPSAELELRTKSVNIAGLLSRKPIKNCIVAFSLSPQKIAKILDVKAPDVLKRIRAIKELSEAGWPIGLRFDPLIFCLGWEKLYSELIASIFNNINTATIHSVSFGPLRFPKDMYRRISNLYPETKLFSFPMEKKGKTISYGLEIENQMSSFVEKEITKYVLKDKIFRCET
tara:strand:+ start:69 stop:1061 length:993 start_codon:yes stop_codon:yes gene_type:complete